MNLLQTIIESLLVQRLGWTLVHSLWQALVVALVLALILPAVRRRSAQGAYALGCGALLLTALLVAGTFVLLPDSRVNPMAQAAKMSPPASDFMVTAVDPHSASGKSPVATIPSERLALPPERPSQESPIFAQRPLAARTADSSLSDQMARWKQDLPVRLSASLPWIVVGWLLGVLGLSVWNIGGWFAVQRLKSRATQPVSAVLEEAAARIARKLGLIAAVRLLQSALVDSPLVIGAWKPVILLPASLVSGMPLDQLESLLAHEMAHVLRRDYLVNLLQTVLETLFFYHPAVWWISSQVRSAREECCDDLAVGLVSDRATYAKALAAVAGARGPALAPAATGGVILPRLRRILGVTDPQMSHPARWLTGIVLLSLVGAAAIGTTWQFQPAKAQGDNSPKPVPAKKQSPVAIQPEEAKEQQVRTKGSMRILVLDRAGHPLPNAQVHVGVWTDEKFPANRDYLTDAQGVARVQLPGTLTILRLWASRTGHAGMFANLDINRRPDLLKREPTIPEEFTFRLPTGTTMGGLVRDESGQPIAGVRVKMSHEYGGVKLSEIARPLLSHDQTTTDAEGRWKLDDIPPGDDVEVSLEVTHPDYRNDEFWAELQRRNQITTRKLRSQTANIILRRGFPLTGKVTDPEGKPVANAVVAWGNRPLVEHDNHVTRTDRLGNYRFRSLPPGPVRVTVAVAGWSPDSRSIEIGPQTPATDFSLKKGKLLRIRFVDHSGASIPGVRVDLERWRGAEFLASRSPVRHFPIPDHANGEGEYEWSWASDDPVNFAFYKQGFSTGQATLAADDNEHSQILLPVLHITGRVQDAVTGRSIDHFQVLPMVYFSRDFGTLDRENARLQKAGALDIDFDRADVEHGFQIEVPGYATYRSPGRYRVGDANPSLDIRLTPVERSRGQIVDSQGRGVPGAHIYVASRFESVELNDLEDHDGDPRAVTRRGNDNHRVDGDQNGTFEIASPLDPYRLIVIAPQGYAEVSRLSHEQPAQIRIQPWAKVSGQLIQSGKPVSRTPVLLRRLASDNDAARSVSVDLEIITGDDGSFTFERVPPVPCRISGSLFWHSPSPLHSSVSIPLSPQPASAVQVTLGQTGVEVTGQLVAEEQPKDFDYSVARNYLVTRRKGGDRNAAVANDQGWSDAWLHTTEGSARLNSRKHWYVKPDPNGRFTISGVEPGDYQFAVNLYGKTEGCLVSPLATGVVSFTVKPDQASLDLGRLSIASHPAPKMGDPASDFEFTGLEGGKSSLSALRGKHVLLSFWATWCRPCVANLDEVERLRQQFAADPGLVVVGMNLDPDANQAKDFLKSRPLPWQHALLGDWSATDVPRRFAISGLPAYVLIDPQGRVMAHENSVKKIAAALQDAGRKSKGAKAGN